VFLGSACQFGPVHRIEAECKDGVLRKRIGPLSEDTIGYALQRQSPEQVFDLGCRVARHWIGAWGWIRDFPPVNPESLPRIVGEHRLFRQPVAFVFYELHELLGRARPPLPRQHEPGRDSPVGSTPADASGVPMARQASGEALKPRPSTSSTVLCGVKRKANRLTHPGRCL